jgi:hypothetical protein
MPEDINLKRRALRKAMRSRNVVALRPPLDCATLAERLREIILGNADDDERVALERELRGLRESQRAMIAARVADFLQTSTSSSG